MMRGFQLTFFTQQNHRHQGQPAGEWLLQAARHLGVRGATLIAATEGFGRHHRIHAARFFELADQPIEVTMAVTEDEADRLLAHLRAEGVQMMFVKAPIEFGSTTD